MDRIYKTFLTPDAPCYMHNIAHEVRTPLTIILGYANLLHSQDLGTLQPEQRKAMAAIISSGHDLWTLVERVSVLMMTQMQNSIVMPVDLARTVTKVLEHYQPATTQARQQVRLRFSAGLPPVVGDPYLVEQALQCLVDNAIKFTPTGGQIAVSVYREAQAGCVMVEDTGIGIAADQLEQIFAPFYQVDASPTRRYGGCGLGLAVVKAVADELGGAVEVDSAPGEGSRFVFKLPLQYP